MICIGHFYCCQQRETSLTQLFVEYMRLPGEKKISIKNYGGGRCILPGNLAFSLISDSSIHGPMKRYHKIVFSFFFRSIDRQLTLSHISYFENTIYYQQPVSLFIIYGMSFLLILNLKLFIFFFYTQKCYIYFTIQISTSFIFQLLLYFLFQFLFTLCFQNVFVLEKYIFRPG